MFKTIIWATDGSEAADRALQTALDLTAESKGKLLVVHADERLGGRSAGAPGARGRGRRAGCARPRRWAS